MGGVLRLQGSLGSLCSETSSVLGLFDAGGGEGPHAGWDGDLGAFDLFEETVGLVEVGRTGFVAGVLDGC